MRRLCLYFSILLPVLIIALSAIAQDELKLNQTYRDVIQLSFPADCLGNVTGVKGQILKVQCCKGESRIRSSRFQVVRLTPWMEGGTKRTLEYYRE